jgi:CBS-domain-containing membrane protein
MRAIDVMTKDVVTATPEMTVQDAAKLMINHRISGVPIVDGDRQLVGIVTEGDLLRRSETGTERQHSPRQILGSPPNTSSLTPDGSPTSWRATSSPSANWQPSVT